MLLIGMFDSPYVRRVAVSMRLLQIPFEHASWSVGRDFDRIRAHNPLGRVPTLVLDDGETLIESSAILDYLDDSVGPMRALLPPAGRERRAALRLMALATGAADKAAIQVYEVVFRPEDKRHAPWVARCRKQVEGALAELERVCTERAGHAWLVAERLSQADVTVTCAYTFLMAALDGVLERAAYPALSAAVERCEVLPEFRAVRAAWSPPSAAA
jgi:glutathione S-transferase